MKIILFFILSINLFAQNNLLLLMGDESLLGTLKATSNVAYYGDFNTTTKNANNKVTALTALIGSTNFVQADTSKAPTWTASGLYFETDDFMTNDGLSTALSGSDKPYTIIITAQKISVASVGTLWSLGSGGGGNPRNYWRYVTTPAFQIFRYDDTGAGVTTEFGTATTSRTIFTHIFTGTTTDTYINKILVSDDWASNVGTMTVTQFTIAALRRVTVAEFFGGYIMQVIVINRAITDAERTAIEKFL